MKIIQCHDVEQLKSALADLPPGSLFRGQTQEYYQKSGDLDLRTSFDRKGCIPHYMLKWQHYAKVMLQSFVRSFNGSDDLATDQAILQHYGWRSFFLDATSRAEVACWFAGNQYREKPLVEMAEDCWENAAFIKRTQAEFESADSQAVVYVLNRKETRRQNIGIVDLVEITTEQGQQRCAAQSAFMVGPLQGQFPEPCLFAKIEAPAELFSEFANSFLDLKENTLFPPPESDPFLATLLLLPLEKMELPKDDIEAFARGLPLPEYSPKFKKIWPPAIAFYRRFWLADTANSDTRFGETLFYLTSESLFHGNSDKSMKFPNITILLKQHASVAVEIDGLVMHPIASDSYQYGKGIYLEYQENGDILLCELSVDHPGGRPSGFGICRGYYYRPDANSIWHRVSHPEECDCGFEPLHKHHATVADHFEDLLARSEFQQHRKRVFITPDVNPNTDPFTASFMDFDV